MFFQDFLEQKVCSQILKQNRTVIQHKEQAPHSIFLENQEYSLYLKRKSIDFLLQYFFAKHLNQLVQAHGIDVISNSLTFLPVLKGGVYLESTIKEFSKLHFIPNEFVGMSSYENTTRKRSNFYLKIPQEKIENKHLILLDEVIDSGETLKQITQTISKQNPASINLFVAINKLTKAKHESLAHFFQNYGVYTTAICFPSALWAVGTLLGLDADQMCRATLDDLFIMKNAENWALLEGASKNPYTQLDQKITAYQKKELTKEKIAEFIEDIHTKWY
jgi:hypoxanthine phosphoribosyltransferase